MMAEQEQAWRNRWLPFQDSGQLIPQIEESREEFLAELDETIERGVAEGVFTMVTRHWECIGEN
jgi:hypothetical protein